MSEYTELVERAELAATSAKASAANTKSDKDTVVSLYNEIKAIIDAGGGGGSCKFYECTSVGDATWSGYEWLLTTKVIEPTPIPVTSFTISDSGIDGLDGTFTVDTDAGQGRDKSVYTNSDGKYCWWYANKNQWCITASVGNVSTVYAAAGYPNGSTDFGEPWEGWTWYNDLNGKVVNSTIKVTPITQEQEPVVTTVYEKSNDITPGLSWTSVKPKVGKSYSADALIEVNPYQGFVIPEDYIHHWKMAAQSEFDDASVSGTLTFGKEGERSFASFNGNAKIDYYFDGLPTGNSPFSMALWVRSTTPFYDASSPAALLVWGSTPGSPTVAALSWEGDGTSWFTNWRKNFIASPVLTDGKWHHLVATHDGTTSRLYIDGSLYRQERITFAIGGGSLSIGGCFWLSYNNITGDLSDVYIFDRAIADQEVFGLYSMY